MTITFAIASHAANPVTLHSASDARSLLSDEHRQACVELLQSTFGSRNARLSSEQALAATGDNGLVHTVVRAYNVHHALVLRPDDIWLAIISQFSFFVNAHAEELRDKFVAHEGKKLLEIRTSGTRYTVDFGALAKQFTQLLAENVVDPELRSWVLPDFSTTTNNDRVVGSVLMMATLKAYFTFLISIDCGIPRLTLEGTRKDWAEIARRVDKLASYGGDAAKWHALLVPVCSRIVKTFDGAGIRDGTLQSEELRDFWGRIVHWERGGSGPDTISGWITAFCAFSNKGKWLGDSRRGWRQGEELVLDGVQYPVLATEDIPPAYAEVDVMLDDNGQKFDTVMVAGLKDARVLSSGDKSLSADGTHDTLAPQVAWWMYTKAGQPVGPAMRSAQSSRRWLPRFIRRRFGKD